ncbi:GAP family protein [Mycobacterium simiae]|uniref:GAP family protein n=1 Tax=Mycobacterium simiae TaxID=1784 RepID=UPI00260816EE|nr:GAP family protein [Mycobacterium simiae]
MWITLLLMAVAMSVEPFRIGMTVLMLNRPRPVLQLSAFLCGGFAMGMTVGLAVVFGLQRRLLDSSHLTLPKLQILTGAMALLVAVVLGAQVWWRGKVGKRREADRLDLREQHGLGKFSRRLLHGRSLWVAGAAGLGIALPSVDYLAALAAIVASGTAAMTRLGALVMFHVVAFALVEIPLLAYLMAPRQTRAGMVALQIWIRSRRRVEVAGALAAAGCLLVFIGTRSL